MSFVEGDIRRTATRAALTRKRYAGSWSGVSPEGKTNHSGIRIICGNGGSGIQNVPGVERVPEKDHTDTNKTGDDIAGVDPAWVFNGRTYIPVNPNS